MTVWIFLAVMAAGGLGALVRFVMDGAIRIKIRSPYPIGTILINITGSFVMGLVSGLVAHHYLSPQWQSVMGTGFLGGYTTFSTAIVETVRLVQDKLWVPAIVAGLGTLVLATAAAFGGWLLGTSGV